MMKRTLIEFDLQDTLGVGTVGTIFRAKDLTNRRDVAVKFLLPAVSNDLVVQARFEREMVILEKLSQPHIIQYFGGGREGPQLFFAMELVTGGSLKEVIGESGALSWLEVITCGIQICSALQYAHNFGIIHRDLKASNLLFTEEGDLRLTDFGVARDLDDEEITSHGLTVGSYAYMAPEQITGERTITGHTDLYGLGCVLFEMLTGRTPFVGGNAAQLLHQHLHADPPSVHSLNEACPQPLDELIHELLQKVPESRPFNARVVQGRLLALKGSKLVEGGRVGDAAAAAAVDPTRGQLQDRLRQLRAKKSADRPRWLSVLILTVVLLIVFFAGWFLGQ